MIVISDDVVLAQSAAGIGANNPRIGWHNVVTPDNVSADEEDADFPVANIANPATNLKWAGTTTAEQSVTVSLGSATTVNYFGIARHNLGTIGATYVFESSTNGSMWTEVTDPRVASNDHAIIQEFDDEGVSFYRLKITPDSGVPIIAVLYVGEILRLQRRIYVGHTPMVYGRSTTVSSGFSESGQFLGRVVRRRMLESAVSMQNITPTWYRSTFEPFVQASAETPFFWAWRPDTYPNEVGYAWLMGDIQPANQRPNGMMQFDFRMQGIR